MDYHTDGSMTSNMIIVFIVPDVPKDTDSPHSKHQDWMPGDRKYSPGEPPRHESDVFPASQRHFDLAITSKSAQSVLNKDKELEEMPEGAGDDLFP